MYYLIKVDGKVGNIEGRSFGIFLKGWTLMWVRQNQWGETVSPSIFPPTLILHKVSDRQCSDFPGSLLPISIHSSYCEVQRKEICSRGKPHVFTFLFFFHLAKRSTTTLPVRCLIDRVKGRYSTWKFKPSGLMGTLFVLHNVKTGLRMVLGLCQTAVTVECMPAMPY